MKSAMTSSPLRVAIIGAGQVADKVHASYYCTRNDLELVAVCDSRISQAQALADKYGNASVWDDPQAMLLAVKRAVAQLGSALRSGRRGRGCWTAWCGPMPPFWSRHPAAWRRTGITRT